MMSSDLIVDFNGYFMPNNEYKIKELSLFLLGGNSRHILANIIATSKPPCVWQKLDQQSKNGFMKYFHNHGISWLTGSRALESILKELKNYVVNSDIVYVRNKEQTELLINSLQQHEDEKKLHIVFLEDLGYAEPLKMSTHCHFHQMGGKTNCANDNLLDMTNWLTTSKLYEKSRRDNMHMVVDFIGYRMPAGVFAIKEFNAIAMDHAGFVTKIHYELTEPPYNWTKLPLEYKIWYDYFYDKHGIPWAKGKPQYNFRSTFRDYFGHVRYVYVRNLAMKNRLVKFIGDEVEIISLEKFGFRRAPRLSTNCPSHDRGKYNCAVDNSQNIVKWLQHNELFKPSIRKNYLNQLMINRKNFV